MDKGKKVKYIGGKVRDVHNPSLAIAFARAEAVANEYHGGHFVLMKFTTNWRFCFGTPTLDHMTIADETFVGHTAEEAIERAIKQEPLLVSGKVAAASDALLEKLLSAKTRGLVDTSQEYIDAIASTPAVKNPRLGDTVTWRDSDAGGMLSGVVTTVYIASVMVATDRGNGRFGYNRVFNDDICSVQHREGA